jgi:hypothetical protein
MRRQQPEAGARSRARQYTRRLFSGLALLCLACVQHPLRAQWQTNGGTIYYNGGNVGIGTNNPGARLDSQIGTTFQTAGRIWHTGDGNNPGQALLVSNGYGASYGFYQVFGVYGNNFGVSYLTVQDNGRVGIGTTNPQHLLHVAGTIGAEEILVTSTGADYVFQPGYRLRPLSEVAQYIEANHHLPDIPSADEVKQKGMGVGDMQAKLLAKIEELTLHMIQADDRNNRLEKQNQDLRDRIARLEAQPAR